MLQNAACSLANFPGNFRSESYVGRPTHHAQRLPDLILGNEAEKGRLLELHRQALPQRAVEDRIARRVLKIGEDNSVFVGQHRRAMEMEVAACDEPR